MANPSPSASKLYHTLLVYRHPRLRHLSPDLSTITPTLRGPPSTLLSASATIIPARSYLASVTRRPRNKVTIDQLAEATDNSRSQLPILLIFTAPTYYRKECKIRLPIKKKKRPVSN